MEDKRNCVYKHTSPSNKVYIGITCREPEKRWGKDGKKYSGNEYFTNAINKYGWDNFKHEILFEDLSKEEACQKEIELIAYYRSNEHDFGYNKSTGGEINRGWHLSEETKRKQSEAKKGCISWCAGKQLPEEMRKNIAANHSHYWQGKKMSEEHCQKISKALTGKTRSPETIRKITESNTGKKRTPEQKRNMSNAQKGHKRTTKVAEAYREYKANGGQLKWNDFQKEYTN